MDNREYTKALKNYPMALNVKEVSEILRVSTKLVYRMVNEEISVDCPATILRNHPDVTVIVDAEAGAKLK